ncbi:MAG: type II toxin-antitoxin system HicB family antitoxin [Treponema sp.]|jgi:predicted RNase H-like HicB family nuclease|nr:type II toxin-antitoxin system HicB family antitoxin [Treponema sp.]
MKTYIALFEYETGKQGFSVVFPDLPGLITAGETYEETLRMAHEGLSSHIKFLQEEKEPVPEPGTLEQIQTTWDEWDEWEKNYKFMVVPVTLLPIITKSKRINVVMNEGLVAKIDMVAKNRSEYISRAVENTFL